MFKHIAVKMISLYQRFLSPYKGFSCAYRTSTHEASCSAYGKKVMDRYGVAKGVKLLRRRLYDCRWHNDWLKKNKPASSCKSDQGTYMGSAWRSQRGVVDCDIPCDCSGHDSCSGPDCNPCDAPGKKGCSIGCCDVVDGCLDCCDIFGKKGHNKGFFAKRDKRNQSKYDKKVDLSKKNE